MLLTSFGGDLQRDHQNQMYKLQEFLSCLEEECRKIFPFKHDLPLCMQLLTNAMEDSRQRLEALGRVNQGTRAVREESIFIEGSATDKESNKFYKANWKASEGTKQRQQPKNIPGFSKDQRSASSQGSSLRGLPDDKKEMDNKKYEEEAGRKRKNSGGNDGVGIERGKGANPVASHAQTSAAAAVADAAAAYTRKRAGRTWSPKQWR